MSELDDILKTNWPDRLLRISRRPTAKLQLKLMMLTLISSSKSKADLIKRIENL